MKWSNITLTKDQIAKHQEDQLIDELQEIYREEDEPEEIALFFRKRQDWGTDLLFPPEFCEIRSDYFVVLFWIKM